MLCIVCRQEVEFRLLLPEIKALSTSGGYMYMQPKKYGMVSNAICPTTV